MAKGALGYVNKTALVTVCEKEELFIFQTVQIHTNINTTYTIGTMETSTYTYRKSLQL